MARVMFDLTTCGPKMYSYSEYSYDVFGGPNRTSSIGNSYFFTGRRLDTETDNYYYRTRYYNPDIGRFLQSDPIRYAAGLNIYSYCLDNPINWVDPYGLCGDTLIETVDNLIPDAVGLSLNLSWVNSILDHIPFVPNIFNDVVGLNLMLFNNGDIGLYTYTTLGENGVATGLDIGFAFEGVTAWGSGPWEGTFLSAVGTYGPITGSYFTSPDGSWTGGSGGPSIGVPAGAAAQETQFTPIIEVDGEEINRGASAAGYLMPYMPIGSW